MVSARRKATFSKSALEVVLCAVALAVCGCGASPGTSSQNLLPISVMLDESRIAISQDGTPVVVQIFIDSPSETALVSFTGMPGGVQVNYQASDTSPSGTLTFVGSDVAPVGTYTPKVTAHSAGQTAMTTFTLVVVK